MEKFTPTPTYDLQRPTGRCAATGGELRPGEDYYATLNDPSAAEDGGGSGGDGGGGLGLSRVDVSLEAWEGGYRPRGVFCYWKTTVPEPTQKRRLFVDDAVLMNLLRRLEGDASPRRLAFRFVLALILMRKRLLRYDHTQRRGDDSWWLLTPKLDLSKGPMGKWDEGQSLEILDPHLTEAEIEGVTQELGQVLDGEV